MTIAHLPGHCIDCIARADPAAHRTLRALSKDHHTAIIGDIPYRSELVYFFKKCTAFMLHDDAIWKFSVETQTTNFIQLQAAQGESDSQYFHTLLQALHARCHASYQEVGEKNVFFFTYKNHDTCYVLTSDVPEDSSITYQQPSIQYQFTWPEAMDVLTKTLPSTVLFGKHYLIHMDYLYHPDYNHPYYRPPPANDDPCLEYALHLLFKKGLEEVFHTSIEQTTLCMPKVTIPQRSSTTPHPVAPSQQHQSTSSTITEQPIVMIHRWERPYAFTFVVRIYDLSVLIWQVAPPPK